MTGAARHDAWTSGETYDAYMGRWSRLIAPLFLDWLAASPDRDWLEIGCGTGALTAAILARAAPRSLLALEPSPGFLDRARAAVADPRVVFRQAGAPAPDLADASRDLVVSGLVLNFLPDMLAGLRDMRRILRPGGTLGFYVWDYPGGGLSFLHAFWTEAVALNPAAADLTEDRRFSNCAAPALAALAERAGFAGIACAPLETRTVFTDFADYWTPFTRGVGPAPGYCASLSSEARDQLQARLRERLGPGPIVLPARVWALRARG